MKSIQIEIQLIEPSLMNIPNSVYNLWANYISGHLQTELFTNEC